MSGWDSRVRPRVCSETGYRPGTSIGTGHEPCEDYPFTVEPQG